MIHTVFMYIDHLDHHMYYDKINKYMFFSNHIKLEAQYLYDIIEDKEN